MPRKQLHFVRALARGLAVLQAFSAEQPKMTLSEIAEVTDLNLAATQRLTDTLLQLGFLQRDRHKRFLLGPKVLSLGFSYLGGSQLRQLAQRYLEEFSRKYNRTLNMAVLDGVDVVFLVRAEQQRFLKFDLAAGSRLPAQLTAQGKVLLAALDDAELRRRVARLDLTKVTSHTLTDPEEVLADLLETRRRGYSICDRELTLDLYTVGVPILTAQGDVTAAINVALRADEAHGDFLTEMTERLFDLGRKLSLELGYRGPYPLIPVEKHRE